MPAPNPAWNPRVAKILQQGGWTISKDTRLATDQGQLVITSTGGDPWLATREVPADAQGPFTLQLRIASRTAGQGVVYYATPDKPNFALAQSVRVPLEHDGAWREHVVQLPVPRLTALRLDPGNAPGTVQLAAFVLLDAQGREVKRWRMSDE